jgi:cytochrome b561
LINAIAFIPVSVATDTSAVYNERVAIVLGFLTLLSLLAVFLSCRSFLSLMTFLRLKNPVDRPAFRKFYDYHAYYWWIFGVFLVAHFIMAFLHTGLPKAGDPGAPVHWAVLLLGFGAALAAGGLLVSCRIMPRIITIVTSGKPFASKGFTTFFKLHAYWWWVILVLVTAHFAVAYSHAGIWPGLK